MLGVWAYTCVFGCADLGVLCVCVCWCVCAQVKWHRLVCDEAAFVKNLSTVRAQAVHRLRKSHCWLITGSPVQNNIRELQNLLAIACRYARVPSRQAANMPPPQYSYRHTSVYMQFDLCKFCVRYNLRVVFVFGDS